MHSYDYAAGELHQDAIEGIIMKFSAARGTMLMRNTAQKPREKKSR